MKRKYYFKLIVGSFIVMVIFGLLSRFNPENLMYDYIFNALWILALTLVIGYITSKVYFVLFPYLFMVLEISINARMAAEEPVAFGIMGLLAAGYMDIWIYALYTIAVIIAVIFIYVIKIEE